MPPAVTAARPHVPEAPLTVRVSPEMLQMPFVDSTAGAPESVVAVKAVDELGLRV